MKILFDDGKFVYADTIAKGMLKMFPQYTVLDVYWYPLVSGERVQITLWNPQTKTDLTIDASIFR